MCREITLNKYDVEFDMTIAYLYITMKMEKQI